VVLAARSHICRSRAVPDDDVLVEAGDLDDLLVAEVVLLLGGRRCCHHGQRGD
jgi:hypothetical protein